MTLPVLRCTGYRLRGNLSEFQIEGIMTISQETLERIRSIMNRLIPENEIDDFMDLNHAITLIKQGEPIWQAPFAIGLYAACLREDIEDDNSNSIPAILDDLIANTLEPLETMRESFKPTWTSIDLFRELEDDQLEKVRTSPCPGDRQWRKGSSLPHQVEYKMRDENSGFNFMFGYEDAESKNERAKMLFFIRFGLGSVLLAKDDIDGAKVILHEMIATRDFGNRTDAEYVKVMIPAFLGQTYADEGDYWNLIYLLAEGGIQWIPQANQVLNQWVEKCSRDDCFDDWPRILAAQADILFSCPNYLLTHEYIDQENTALSVEEETEQTSFQDPSGVGVLSAEFQAWKLGQLVGMFSILYKENPIGKLEAHHDVKACKEYIMASWDETHLDEDPPDFFHGWFRIYREVNALLSQCVLHTDWHKFRKRCEDSYELSLCCHPDSGVPNPPKPGELVFGDHIYWAMMIGLAEKMLEASPKSKEFNDELKTITSRIGLEVISMKNLLEQLMDDQRSTRLPTLKEITSDVAEKLSLSWDTLSSDVVHYLVCAEESYYTVTRPHDAVINIHLAAETHFKDVFVSVFNSYLKQKGSNSITVTVRQSNRVTSMLIGPKAKRDQRITDISRLSLGWWGAVFSELTDLSRNTQSNPVLWEFMKTTYTNVNSDDLRLLGTRLKRIQSYRNPSTHPDHPLRSFRKEKQDLDDIRSLVFGIGQDSVIDQITRIFRT